MRINIDFTIGCYADESALESSQEHKAKARLDVEETMLISRVIELMLKL